MTSYLAIWKALTPFDPAIPFIRTVSTFWSREKYLAQMHKALWTGTFAEVLMEGGKEINQLSIWGGLA